MTPHLGGIKTRFVLFYSVIFAVILLGGITSFSFSFIFLLSCKGYKKPITVE